MSLKGEPMEKSRAIDLLDNLIGMIEDNQDNDYDTAFRMAIEALNAQLSREDTTSDMINRQDAIDIFDDYNASVENGDLEAYSRDRKRLCELPSAQPEEIALHESCTDCPLYDKDRYRCPRFNKVIPETLRELQLAQSEPHWIPVSERMPEEHEWIGTKKFGTTISDEVYVTFENEKGERFCKHLSFQNGELSSYDKAHMDVWYKGSKPIAWMPLPEPYKLNK